MNDLHQMMPHSQIFQNNHNYAVWPHPPPPYPPENAAAFASLPAFSPHPGRVKRNGRKDFHRTGSGPVHGFKSVNPNPKDSQPPPANRSAAKGRRLHYLKRKFGVGGGGNRLTPPFAPRNTTSFIIRAKKSGGIAPLVSPVTPAILSSPAILPAASLSPATFDEAAAKEQWGFNGYGSMKGFIRLRPGKCGSGEDTGEISGAGRFEMVYPNSGEEQNLDKRVDEQDTQIAHLEEENLTLKERLILMERQLGELRRRVLCLETDGTKSRAGEGEAQNFLAGDVCSVKSDNNGVGGGDASNNNADHV
ncbi:hypothetical protein E2542_SST26947 [Spatholobus suberectus]|nr:hypothetical protein E2542_SST26947 [Spatholobus suberectus]